MGKDDMERVKKYLGDSTEDLVSNQKLVEGFMKLVSQLEEKEKKEVKLLKIIDKAKSELDMYQYYGADCVTSAYVALGKAFYE